MGSGRRKRFLDLATQRVSRAENAIRLVGNLANKSNYEYTDSEVKQIITALQDALQGVKVKFKSSSKKKGFQFK
tara:strand:+ start:195 stop:416 length:222 start_codon:yes stop_codon:yes gene_type:complete